MKIEKNKVRKILIVTLSNLGDVVLTLPVFEALCLNFPEALIDVVVGEHSKIIFEGHPKIGRIFVYSRKISFNEKIEFIKKIRQNQYAIAIDLRRSLIGLLAKAKHRNSYLDRSKKSMHRALRHFRSLRSIGITEMPPTSFLKSYTGAEVSALLEEGDGETPLILAACGSKSDIKKWPAVSFAALLDRLIDERGARVVLIGDKNEAALSAEVQNLMNGKEESVNLCGRTNFTELLGVIKKASLVITNDSAPLHIADSLKIPVLALFGPTNPLKYGPLGKRSAVAKKNLFCSPCEEAQCRYQHECMKELGVDEVYKKAAAILSDLMPGKKPRILLIRLDRIGDAVLSLPAVQAVRDAYPQSRISVMARPYTREIFERHAAVDEVIVYDYEKSGRHGGPVGNARFIWEIIKGKFDIAFALNPSVRSHLVPFCAGIPYRIGFDSKVPFALTTRVTDLRHLGLKHESEYTLDVVRAFKVPVAAEKELQFSLFEEDERKAESLLASRGVLAGKKIVALHAGASDDSKKWPKERFAELGRKTVEELDCRVLIVGGKNEKELGAYLAAQIGKAAVDLTNQLGLTELAAILKKSACLVTNDSGPVHIAAAVGTPTVCIFGRNRAGLNASRWRALGPRNTAIQKDVGCVVCLAHECTIDFECLKAVQVQDVFDNVKASWNKA